MIHISCSGGYDDDDDGMIGLNRRKENTVEWTKHVRWLELWSVMSRMSRVNQGTGWWVHGGLEVYVWGRKCGISLTAINHPMKKLLCFLAECFRFSLLSFSQWMHGGQQVVIHTLSPDLGSQETKTPEKTFYSSLPSLLLRPPRPSVQPLVHEGHSGPAPEHQRQTYGEHFLGCVPAQRPNPR